MKKNILSIACAFLVMATASAQDLKSSYFMKSDNYRHDLNAAFMGESGYVSFPVLGNLNVSTQGNIGLNDFLYKTDGDSKYKLTTFLSPTVDRNKFLGKLKEKNRINANLGISLFSVGATTRKGYNTFEVNMKSTVQTILPYELFDFMKTGMGNGSYNLKNLSMRSRSYLEVAIGHSRHINKRLDVGVKLKVLAGVANADAKFDSLMVTLDQNRWQVHSKGTMNLNLRGASFKYDKDEGFVNNVDMDGKKAGVAGWGGAIDMGAVYKVMDGFTVSGAVLDLGMIRWKKSLKASSNQTFTFDGFKNIAVNPDNSDDENSIKEQWKGIRDDMKKLSHFYEDKNDTQGKSEMLNATMNLGAEYELPYYRKLSFGFLSSTTFAGKYTATTAMLSANVRPIKLIEASMNCSYSTYGASFGGMLSIHPHFFTFFIGSDYIVTKVTPQYVPVSKANCNVSMGLNFAIY